jgi:hypothetical protein
MAARTVSKRCKAVNQNLGFDMSCKAAEARRSGARDEAERID